jgi:hypothetical protein
MFRKKFLCYIAVWNFKTKYSSLHTILNFTIETIKLSIIGRVICFELAAHSTISFVT